MRADREAGVHQPGNAAPGNEIEGAPLPAEPEPLEKLEADDLLEPGNEPAPFRPESGQRQGSLERARLEEADMDLRIHVAPASQIGMRRCVASRQEQQSAGTKKAATCAKQQKRIGQVLDDLDGGDDIVAAVIPGKVVLPKDGNAARPRAVGNPPRFETRGLTRPRPEQVTHEPAVSAAVIQPPAAGVERMQRAHDLEDALPFQAAHRRRRVLELEEIIDEGICPFSLVVALVVDIGEVLTGVCDEAEAARPATAQPKERLRQSAALRAGCLGGVAADAAGALVAHAPSLTRHAGPARKLAA